MAALPNPLRVALDATPLLGRRTGVGQFCAGVLPALSRQPDLEVSAFAMTWRGRHQLASVLPQGVAAVRRAMPARLLQELWARWPLPSAELCVGRADVVHGTNFVVPPSRRATMVVSVHDLTPLRFPQWCRPAALAYPVLVQKAVQRGAWVHTDSAAIAREVVELLGVPEERVRTVHLGVPAWDGPALGPAGPAGATPQRRADNSPSGPGVRQAEATADEPAEDSGAGPGGSVPADLLPQWVRRYVLALGTVEPRKDLPSLVRAFGMLAGHHPGLALVVAGPDGWGSAQLAEALEACPARDQVVRLGWVSEEDRGRLMSAATVFAYPSRYEGFGLPPLEAMAAGVPVVATRCAALEEVLGDAARLVEVGNAEALAGALDDLLGDVDSREELAKRGRQRAERFTWEACAERLADLYRDALSQ
ncbi:MAG: glycosyltransferase family 4 protein [Acidimicrobiales bacterium]